MRQPFIVPFTFILLASLLLTSCATLVSGTKQGVRINTNVPDALLLIDDEIETQSGEMVRLSRKKSHTLEVDMEGYEKVEYDFTRRINPLVWGNMALFPVALVTGIVLASQKETVIDNTYGFPLETEEYKEPQFTIGLLTASLSFLLPALPFGVDALTGAMYRIDKEVDIELFKLPEPFNPAEVITTQVDRVNIKIDPRNEDRRHAQQEGNGIL